MPVDKQTIETALKLWFRKDNVFEVRVLDAVSSDWMRPHMESGYFDYDHIADAADAIGRRRNSRTSHTHRFGNIRRRGDMRRASLANIQLHGTDFATDFIFHGDFQRLSGTGKPRNDDD